MPALTNSRPRSKRWRASPAWGHRARTIWYRATRLSVAAIMEQAEADAEEIRQSARTEAAILLAGTESADLDHPPDA